MLVVPRRKSRLAIDNKRVMVLASIFEKNNGLEGTWKKMCVNGFLVKARKSLQTCC
jgi:hypothetical protein